MQTIDFPEIIGERFNSPEFIAEIKDIADSDGIVLITGETGTGKDVLAKMIVKLSKRKNKPFISVNCASIPESLLETTLFGHKKGAFTSAIDNQKGYLEEANGGTIFLDEIAETSLNFQAALLKVLEDGFIRRVGENKEIHIDVRFLFATNKNLKEEIRNNRFRKDLFYRIDVFDIKLEPLRERPEDIEKLAYYFLSIFAEKNQKQILYIAPETLKILKKQHWDGNVRQLKNVMERAVVKTKSDTIIPSDLPKIYLSNTAISSTDKKTDFINLSNEALNHSYEDIKESFDKQYFLLMLDKTNGNISEIAKISDLNRKTLYNKFKKLGIKI